tara:strand:+ start:590 stop:1492 length:903 start_codon:yes stop_codon:yes gene_type:complete
MKDSYRDLIIKIINLLDSKLDWMISKKFTENKIKLNIYSLHSTRSKDFSHYRKLLKYINKKSNFINPNDIEYLSTGKFKNDSYSILTLDDGFNDNHKFALEVLNELNIKAIFFIIPKFISERNKFSIEYFHKLYPENRNEITNEIKNIFQHMNKNQIYDLIKEGHEIGLHGLEHEDYGKINTHQINKNIIKSFNILKKINLNINHFAYPFGSSKNFTYESNKNLSKYFRYIYTGVRGINIIKKPNNRNFYIFRRNTLSTHKSDLIYFPISLQEVHFFSFNKIVYLIYQLLNLFKKIKNEY